MKNLMLIVFLLLSTLTNAQSKLKTEPTFASINTIPKNIEHKLMLNLPSKTYSHNSNNNSIGVALLISGAAFVVGGLLTPTPYEGFNGKDKPFFQQGPRMYAIVGGALVVGTSLVIIIN